MTDFKYADFQPYEQNLWHAPTIKSQGLWHESSYKFGTIPEPLYRLRLSVLNNNQGRDDCPSRIYVYPTLETFTNAINEIYDSFGGSFPKCKIQYGNPLGIAKTTEEAVMAGVDDARTRSVVLLFDPQSANENWTAFMARMANLEKRWTEETDSE
ncbi:hypothetical protein MMC28_007863 [Mycoblastus sanguinarius]|nr:hypothetical protein [Mycoblastus sanguinarius]